MQPNLNRTSTGLGKVTPPLPKSDLLPKSLLSPLGTFLGYSTWKKPEELFLYQGNVILFLLSSHWKKNPFFTKFFRHFFLRCRLRVVFGCSSPLIFTTEKGSVQFKSGLPQQLWGILGGKRALSPGRGIPERGRRELPALCCAGDDRSAGEMSLSQITRIRTDCKEERFWWLKWWPSVRGILLPLHSG